MTMTPNQQAYDKNGSVDRIMRMLDTCATSHNDGEETQLLGMAAKAFAQLQSHADRVTTGTMYWQDRYKRMRQSYDVLLVSNMDLEKENARLLLKCRQLEDDERERSDNRVREDEADDGVRSDNRVPGEIDNMADEKEQQDYTYQSGQALFEAALIHETTSPVMNCGNFNFSGDACKQLDQVEDSLDMESEEFLEQCKDNDKKGAFESDSEQTSFSPCCDVTVGKTLTLSPLQDKTPSKDGVSESNSSPFQLIRRLFPTKIDDVSMPAMTPSDSMFSMATTLSISPESSYMRQTKSSAAKRILKRDGLSKSSDSMFSLASANSFSMESRVSNPCLSTPAKKMTEISSQRNEEWAIME